MSSFVYQHEECKIDSHEQMVKNRTPALGSFEEIVDSDLTSSVACVATTRSGVDWSSK